MNSERINIWKQEEYTYPLSFGFTPNFVSYIHEENDKLRPCILVVPGGGYCIVSPTEGEIVAMEFYERGYNTFVLTYTTNLLMKEPLKDQPMKDLSRTIRYIRKNSDKYHINPAQLVICGFSAGGHLCGSVCVHYEDVEDANPEYAGISNRPDAAILSYPVITSGEKAHRDSFRALLGEDAGKEELSYMSLENCVTADTPPAFLWQTATDDLVPVENSYLFAEACKEKGVTYAHHVFSQGGHGLSLANEKWAAGEYGDPYPMEQTDRLIARIKSGSISLPEKTKKMLLSQFDMSEEESKRMQAKLQVNNEVRIWPELADRWIKTVLR
jgi:acetyl esterase/lipase